MHVDLKQVTIITALGNKVCLGRICFEKLIRWYTGTE